MFTLSYTVIHCHTMFTIENFLIHCHLVLIMKTQNKIEKNPDKKFKKILNELGKKSLTRFELVERCELKPSRTHEILTELVAKNVIEAKRVIYGKGRPQFVYSLK